MWRPWQKKNSIVVILMLVLISFWRRCMHSDTLLGNHVLDFIFYLDPLLFKPACPPLLWHGCVFVDYFNLHLRLYYDTDAFFFHAVVFITCRNAVVSVQSLMLKRLHALYIARPSHFHYLRRCCLRGNSVLLCNNDANMTIYDGHTAISWKLLRHESNFLRNLANLFPKTIKACHLWSCVSQ